MTTDQPAEVGAIIAAAGRSERMAGRDKLWTLIAGADGRRRPLLAYSLAVFQACSAIQRIVLVTNEATLDQARALVRQERFDHVSAVVPGGSTRQDSVRAGLQALGDCTWVVVHDGARPLVTEELIERGLDAAKETGAACCALPVPDTVKEGDADGRIVRTLDRSRLWLAQTPQVFRYDLLMKAHRQPHERATDDAALLEAMGMNVRLYQGSPRNLKVTALEDLALVEALLVQTP